MHFYIDESGHTGANLFDPEQPILYYGVLSSKVNVDAVAEASVVAMRRSCGVERLHGAELGNAKLPQIVPALVTLQKKMDLRFDVYSVAKPDHAIICFFDQVFDQGVNPAVTWTGYWTPMRYVLLLKVASLFDEELARLAWDARIEINDAKAEKRLLEVCAILRERIARLPDERSRQLIGDALAYVETFPDRIFYNVKNKDMLLQVTPNVVGFQQVMIGVAARIRKHGREATRIVVDQQIEFNGAQKMLAGMYAAAKDAKLVNGPGLPKIDMRDMPTVPINFTPGTMSPGLEIVDVYLWIFKRAMEQKDLAPELYQIIRGQQHRGQTDQISLNGIASRWEKWFAGLPEPTEDQIRRGQEMLREDEARRLKAVQESKGAKPPEGI